MGDKKLRFPKYIYKYYRFDEYYEDILVHENIFLSSPGGFNDPFDCMYKLRFSGISQKELTDYLIYRQLPNQGIVLTEELINQAKTFVDENLDELNPNDPKIESLLQKGHIEFNNNLGISCFSEEKDTILMWGHYAKGHSGFVVQFDTMKLLEQIISSNETQSTLYYFDKVVYTKDYPNFSAYETDELVRTIFCKYMDWSYEKEWRLILENGNGKKLKLEPGTMKGIYLGMCSDKLEDVKNIIKQKSYKILLYHASKSLNNFSLDFNEVLI